MLDLDAPWAPEQYHDEYVEKLEQVVDDVQTLTGIVQDEIMPAMGADIVDLTELLRKSLRKAPAADRSAANDEEAPHQLRKAAAKKASEKSSASVKPRRKRA